MAKITKQGYATQQKYNRQFSTAFKKEKVKQIEQGLVSVRAISKMYGVSRRLVYNWIYLYTSLSPGLKTVIQMESEQQKTLFYQQRVAELERIVGQKQMEIEYLNKTLEIATEELGYDVKKSTNSHLGMG